MKIRLKELRSLIRELLKAQSMITPSLEVVKYEDMPNKQWYMSPHHKGWYYHVPRTEPSHPKASILEPTLDPCLKELAVSLNSAGYATLPSCSGHYYSKKQCDKIYADLLKDAKEIQKDGLNLVDVESGNSFLFQDPLWTLPWNQEEFFSIASGTDSKPEGYIGFMVPEASDELIKFFEYLTNKIPGTKFKISKQSPNVKCELRVYTGDPKSQCMTWKHIGNVISKYLNV